MLSVANKAFMLRVTMLNAVVLSVVTPSVMAPLIFAGNAATPNGGAMTFSIRTLSIPV